MLKKTLKAGYRRLPFKRHAFELLRKALPTVPEFIFKHLHFEGPFKVVVDGASSFQIIHDGTSFHNELFWLGLSSYEQTSLQLWCHLASRASVIVDGGANSGLYSLIAEALNRSADILAFEPEPRIYERLAANTRLSPSHIRAEKLALSEVTGYAEFYVPPDDNPVGSTLDKQAGNDPSMKRIIVKTVRLDEYLKEHQLPGADLLKLDVEGNEASALIGMGAYLDQCRPTIIAEILNDEVGTQVAEVLRDKAYQFFLIKEGEGVFPVSTLSSPPGKFGQNFLLCSGKIALELGL